jgi:diguanylate cyclase (GGDEF)-like protein
MSAGQVLIVDDDANNLALLAQILREAGYSVRVSKGGRRALETIATQPPELVMLDIRMPDLDGLEVCRRLKRNAATSRMPVIFISALDDVFEKVRAFGAGGADYVTKPFQPAEVLARVENQLGMARMRRELEEKNRELEGLYRDLERTNEELARANTLLASLSYLDGLTGIPNRRHLHAVLEREWRRCTRGGLSLSVMMIDIDEFKLLNDSLGHPAGDACLTRVAAAITSALRRGGDLAARYGGEEFCAVLPDTDAAGAAARAEEVRARVEALAIPNVGSAFGVVTVSVGVASDVPGEDSGPDALLTAADEALYRAKRAGRNRAAYAPPRL